LDLPAASGFCRWKNPVLQRQKIAWILLGLAAVNAAEGDYDHAYIHLQIIEGHPSTSRATLSRAAALRAKIESRAAQQAHTPITLEQAIAEILSQP
jgi:hypothetical protein